MLIATSLVHAPRKVRAVLDWQRDGVGDQPRIVGEPVELLDELELRLTQRAVNALVFVGIECNDAIQQRGRRLRRALHQLEVDRATLAEDQL